MHFPSLHLKPFWHLMLAHCLSFLMHFPWKHCKPYPHLTSIHFLMLEGISAILRGLISMIWSSSDLFFAWVATKSTSNNKVTIENLSLVIVFIINSKFKRVTFKLQNVVRLPLFDCFGIQIIQTTTYPHLIPPDIKSHHKIAYIALIRFCRSFQQTYIIFTVMQSRLDDEERQMLLAPNSAINQSKIIQPQSTPTEIPEQIIHKVQYGDTLQGLSLQYSVPIGKIRYRNHIDGDSIYHLKQIIIPNPMTIPASKQSTQALLIEQFVSTMDYSEKSAKVAKYYLQQTDWNMQAALKQYRQDLEWQRKNKNKIVNQSVHSGNSFQMKEIRHFYDKMSLMQKKRN